MKLNNFFKTLYLLLLPLSVVQLYLLKIGDIVLSLYFILNFFLIIYLFDRKIRKIDIFSFSYIFLFFATLFSLLWSLDTSLVIRSLIFLFSGYIVFCYTRKLMLNSPDIVERSFYYLSFFIAFHSLIVSLFFFLPLIEEVFLNSSIAKLFINNNALQLYQVDLTNNVKDPNKAGGFFLNGNTAAILSEIGFYLSLILKERSKYKLLSFLVIINFLGIIFTGSKSALFLACFSFILSYFIYPIFYEKSNVVKKQLFLLFYICIFIIIYQFILSLSSTTLYEDGIINAERRKVIFEFAYLQFIEHPFLGLGFGGWEKEFFNYGEGLKNYGLNGGMPAHNYFIISWSRGGLILLFAAFIYYFVFFYSLKFFNRYHSKKESIYLLSIFLCLLIHTFMDNVIIYEEVHYSGIFAAILGWAAYSKGNKT